MNVISVLSLIPEKELPTIWNDQTISYDKTHKIFNYWNILKVLDPIHINFFTFTGICCRLIVSLQMCVYLLRSDQIPLNSVHFKGNIKYLVNLVFPSWTLKGYSHFASQTTLLLPLNLTAVDSAPKRGGRVCSWKNSTRLIPSTVYPLPSIQMYSEIPEPSYF
jgi:hypothetical protein